MQQSREDRSLGELFGQLTRDISALARQEVTLAKTEMSQKAAQAGKDVGFLAVGGAVAYAGFLAILAAIVIVLASFLPWWLSALIVGVVVAGIGYFLIQKGRENLSNLNPAPEQTIETLKEDREWAKEQMR
jgi:hypothetical protein